MFIEPGKLNKQSSLRRSEMLFHEVENVLVIKRDVKLSEPLAPLPKREGDKKKKGRPNLSGRPLVVHAQAFTALTLTSGLRRQGLATRPQS